MLTVLACTAEHRLFKLANTAEVHCSETLISCLVNLSRLWRGSQGWASRKRHGWAFDWKRCSSRPDWRTVRAAALQRYTDGGMTERATSRFVNGQAMRLTACDQECRGWHFGAAPQKINNNRQKEESDLCLWPTHLASFLKPMALFLVGVPLTPFHTWLFQGSAWPWKTTRQEHVERLVCLFVKFIRIPIRFHHVKTILPGIHTKNIQENCNNSKSKWVNILTKIPKIIH